MNLKTKIAEIHSTNLNAGWWTDIKSGKSILYTRSRPEMLMLTVSELAEAYEGLDGRPDDKLSQYPMVAVELADTFIRLADLIGAEQIDFEDLPSVQFSAGEPVPSSLMKIVSFVAVAMEGHRKGNRSVYEEGLLKSMSGTINLAHILGYDFETIVDEKILFNKNRSDHKIENRLKSDGKKY